VIALLRCLRRRHDRGIAHQVRLVLRCLSGQETVEVLRAVASRPVVERARRAGFERRSVVPLAEGSGGIPVVLQDLGAQRAALRDLAGVSVPIVGQLRELPVADAVMVAAGQQRRPRRRAHGSGMEAVVPDVLVVDSGERVGLHLTAIGSRQATQRGTTRLAS
jgi:hypothetical protein